MIAILICDTPAAHLIETYGDYGTMFKRLLSSHEILCFDVTKGVFPPKHTAFDAYLITGSRYSAYDPEEWIQRLKEFIKELDESRSKVIGICFGHQIIAEALGGKVNPNELGWEVSVCKVAPNLAGETYLRQKGDFNIQQMHKDIVSRVPKEFLILAADNQVMYKPKQYLTFQGHPEFSAGYVSDLIKMRIENGIFDLESGNEYLSRAVI